MSLSVKKLEKIQTKNNSLVCVGLDSDITKLPKIWLKKRHPQYAFNKWIIGQTHQYVCAYKPNIAFYEARGHQGWKELQMTMNYLKKNHPQIVTICDAKRADIGNTNTGYVTAILDQLGFDAITLHPYLGKEALEPFLKRKDKGLFILCKTSNPGAGELQNLKVRGKPLWQAVAQKVSQNWNKHKNCGLVVGATYPKELKAIRGIVGDMPLLVPGVGAQGGDVKKNSTSRHG